MPNGYSVQMVSGAHAGPAPTHIPVAPSSLKSEFFVEKDQFGLSLDSSQQSSLDILPTESYNIYVGSASILMLVLGSYAFFVMGKGLFNRSPLFSKKRFKLLAGALLLMVIAVSIPAVVNSFVPKVYESFSCG